MILIIFIRHEVLSRSVHRSWDTVTRDTKSHKAHVCLSSATQEQGRKQRPWLRTFVSALYCCHPLQGLATLTFQKPNRHLFSKYLSNTCEPGTVAGTNGGLTGSALKGLTVYWDLGPEQGEGRPSLRTVHSIQTRSPNLQNHVTSSLFKSFISVLQMKHQEEELLLVND